MRKFYYSILVSIGLAGISSCSQDDYALQGEVNSQNEISTRTVQKSDTLLSDSIIPLVIDSNIVKNKQARTYSSYAEYDENFVSNMWEIRELPIKIRARGKGNTDNDYLRSNGKGEEIKLGTLYRGDDTGAWFYLKILPGSSGIPYLIYSYSTRTPIAVGQYNSNPNNKVVFILPSESGSLSTASWDLIPSSSYKGYFAIQSESYLGLSDPNDMWSMFNYVVEAKNDNKVGYGQYTKKAQQEFLITQAKTFTLDYIEFHKEGATVTKQAPLKTTTYSKNETEERVPFTIEAVHYADDTSSFSENSALKIPIGNATKKFYRPIVVAEHIVPPLPVRPEDDPNPVREDSDIVYSSATQQIHNKLEFKISGIAKPHCLIEATSYLENYTVSAKYTAHMSYKDNKGILRKVKISGIWKGVMFTTIRDNKYPTDIIKYFDLDDGEEIMRLKSIKLSPITFK